MTLTTLPLPSWPFDLAATLGSGQSFHWQPHASGWLGCIGEDPVWMDQPEPGLLRCTSGMEDKVRHFLALDHDMERLTATFPATDTGLAAAVRWCPGLRILRQPRWECLATFITSSMKQVAHIRQISLTLRQKFGVLREVPDCPPVWSYPAPQAMAAAGEDALRACGLGYRAAFLHRAAVEVAEGRVDLQTLGDGLSDAAAEAALCALHGVGPKIAQCALLFAWERLGAFPVDVWVERVLKTLYFSRRRKKLTSRELREFALKHFGPHRGLAQQFLFHWARLTDCGSKNPP